MKSLLAYQAINYVLGLMPGWFWRGQYIRTSEKNGFIVKQPLYEILTNEGHVKAPLVRQLPCAVATRLGGWILLTSVWQRHCCLEPPANQKFVQTISPLVDHPLLNCNADEGDELPKFKRHCQV